MSLGSPRKLYHTLGIARIQDSGRRTHVGIGKLLHRREKHQNVPCDNLVLAVLNELVAQLVEQRPFKAWVVGPNPTELTIQNTELPPKQHPSFRKRRRNTKAIE